MRPAIALALVAALAAGGVSPAARAQSWAPGAVAEKGAFTVPVALFVQEHPPGYGMYTARATTRFKDDESLVFYLEPVGYQYKQEGGRYRFGASVDLRLLKDGKPVFSKDGFLNAAFTSHHQNKEINFTGTMDVKGAPKGDYQLELSLQDTYGSGTAKVVLPFSID